MQAQIDGNVVHAKFTLPQRQKVSSPPRGTAAVPKKDGPRSDAVDVDKDAPRRPRECILLLTFFQ